MESQERHRAVSGLIIGVVTLAAMLGASLLPEMRLWGLASWARMPAAGAVAALGGMVLLLIGWRVVPAPSSDVVAKRAWRLGVIGGALGAAAGFFILRTKVHFLGDGYTALSLLASERPLIKTREIGESIMHVWVKSISGLEGEAAALFSFRALSIGAGVALLLVAAWAAARLFAGMRQRVLFVAGMLTGGYALLFFGYVENYSLFVAAVGIYALAGLLAARGEIARWWLLGPLAAAILCHVLGVTLLPSAVYLWLAPTRIGRQRKGWSSGKRVALGSALVVGLLWGMIGAWQASLFFRYSLVSPVVDSFTVGGYTLFSSAHLVDWVNLLLLLLPGLGLLVLALTKAGTAGKLWAREAVFLIVLSLSACGAVFLFDPKLGMPRDWDLFAFAGIGLSTLLYVLTLDAKFGVPNGAKVAWMAIVLALVSLGGRVAMVNSPPVMIARFNDYLELDPRRDLNARYLLMTYYQNQGDSAKADTVRQEWSAAFPVRDKTNEALDLKKAGQLVAAARLLEEVAREEPSYYGAWSNLGEIMMRFQFWDSAIVCLDMAIGLNPYDASAYSNRGVVRLHFGQREAAMKDFERSLAINPDIAAVVFNLASAYRQAGRHEEAEEQIRRMAAIPEKVMSENLKLFEWYAGSGRVGPAIAQLREALGKGADTAYVRGLLEQYPAVVQALRR